jgi:filamentous hemagglutinin
VSLVNNQGDLGAVLKELGSSEGIKNIATAMVTAGAIEGLGSTITMDVNGVATPLNQISPQNGSFTQTLGRHVVNASARAVVNTAIHGGSLQDHLAQGIADAVVSAGAAMGAYEIGQWTSPGIDPATGAVAPPALNRFAGEVAHAIVGCAAGTARTGNADGCAPGAVGAVAGHLAAGFINPTGDPSRAAETIAWSQVMSGVAGAIVGTNGQSVYVAAGTGANAVENNYLTSQQWRTFSDEMQRCQARSCTPQEQQAIRESYQQLSNQQNVALANCSATGSCATLGTEVASGTETMLELAANGRLPGGGAVANDLGQHLGQRLASDLAYRERVNHSIAVLDNCNANPDQCTQQAITAAALVVAPLLGPAGVPITAEGLVVGGTIGAGFNALGQYAANGSINPRDVGMAFTTGALTYGAGFWPSLFVNTGGALSISAIKNDTPNATVGGITGAALGTAIGYPAGTAVQGGLNTVLNPWYRPMWQDTGYTIQRWIGSSPLPGAFGTVGSSALQEVGNATVNSQSTTTNSGNPTLGGK